MRQFIASIRIDTKNEDPQGFLDAIEDLAECYGIVTETIEWSTICQKCGGEYEECPCGDGADIV